MIKLFISLSAAGTVLTAGLVSCSPEKKEIDVYRAKPPVIRSEQGAQDLKTWELRKNKELDLESQIDFSESAPARAEVQSHCKVGDDNFHGRGSFSNPAAIHLWQVLPTELLTREIKNVECGFEMSLYNSMGSNHVYTLSPVPLHEKLGAAAEISANGNRQLPPKLVPEAMADFHLRFFNSQPASVKMICQDMETRPLPFDQVLDLSHFDFNNPVFRAGGTTASLRERPAQKCRALLSQNGRPVGLSNLVTVVTPRPAISVRVVSGKVEAGYENLALQKFAEAKPVEIVRYEIKNPDAFPRRLRISKRRVRVGVQVFFELKLANGSQAVQKMNYPNLNAVHFAPLKTKTIEIHEDQVSYTFTLNPQEEVSLLGIFQSQTRSHCARDVVKGIQLSDSEPLALEELDRDGQVVSTFRLQTAGYSLFRPDLATRYQAVHEFPPCEWY